MDSVKLPAPSAIVSWPEPAAQASTAVSVFAAITASRREQSPSLLYSSVVVLTVMVAAQASGLGNAAQTVAAPSRPTSRPRPSQRRMGRFD